MKNIYYVFLMILLVLMSCWKKQDNDITKPQVPFYTLNGNVINWLDDTILSDIKLELISITQLYDVDFETVQVMSDSAGQYVFDHVNPGLYMIVIYRDDIMVRVLDLQVNHEDIFKDYRVPEPLTVKRMRSDKKDFYSKGLAIDRENAMVWLVDVDSIQALTPYSNLWRDYGTRVNPVNGSYISTVTLDDSLIYFCQPPDTITVLDQNYTKLRQTYYHSGLYLQGLVFDKDTREFYGCTNTNLVRFGNNINEIQEIIPVNASAMQPMAINDGLFVFDNAYSVCYRFDDELKIVNVFSLIDIDNHFVYDRISDMDFDSEGTLWVVPSK